MNKIHYFGSDCFNTFNPPCLNVVGQRLQGTGPSTGGLPVTARHPEAHRSGEAQEKVGVKIKINYEVYLVFVFTHLICIYLVQQVLWLSSHKVALRRITIWVLGSIFSNPVQRAFHS